MGSERKTLCVDFDGVLHSYTSGWQGAHVVTDDAVPGAVEWLVEMLAEGFDVCIYSSRSKEPTGVGAMRGALRRWGMDPDDIDRLDFPTEKPAAWLTIDDRCFRFEGDFPSAAWLRRFRPWNK